MQANQTVRRPFVASCVSEREHPELVGALRSRTTLRLIPSIEDLWDLLRHHTQSVDIVILVQQDRAADCSLVPIVRRIRNDWPRTVIVVCCPRAARRPTEIPQLYRAGMDHLLWADIAETWNAALDEFAAVDAGSIEVVGARIKELTPGWSHRLIDHSINNAGEARPACELAQVVGMQRRTLFRMCSASCLPPPAELSGWCRVFLAAHLLEQRGRAIEAIASEMSLDSASALCHLMKRYTGLSSSEIRDAGGLDYVIALFQRRIRELEA